MISLERLKQRVSYNPKTGLFIWRETFSGMCREGWPAGRLGTGKAAGYMRVTIDRREYKAHRLAWFYMTGEWPSKQIDHINGNPSDNRWCNLRLATQSQNKANSKPYKNNRSGVKGVSWDKTTRKWNAAIQFNGKQKHLGRFKNIDEAAEAYRRAAEEIYGSFHRTE